MKYIEYRSFWKYSNLWILHSVFILDWIVWSWEISFPFFWQGQFILYKEEEWKKTVKEIIREEEIDEIDLSPYKDIKLRWINCVEVLDKIMRENSNKHIIPFWFYVYRKLNFAFKYLLVMVIFSILFYYSFTVSEEDFIKDNKHIICQE